MPQINTHSAKWGKALTLLALALAAALPLTLPATSYAQPVSSQAQEQQEYQIPAGSLEQALNTLGRQAGIVLMFSSELVSGKSSRGLNGSFTPGQALERLLDGTGLVTTPQSGGGYSIAVEQQGVTTLPPVKISADSIASTTEGTGSYTTDSMSTATGLPLSLRETPQSVSVITRQRMEDQSLLSIEDALGQSTGFTVLPSGADDAAPIYARGFQVDTFQYDGVAQASPDYSFGKPDLAPYDRVEVLRGAAGLLQGAGNPSAAVNLVRKRPAETFAASGTAYVGSWGYYRTEVDVGGPLNISGSLRGRAVVAYEDRDYFVDIAESQKTVLYAIGEYDLASSTKLTAGVNIQRSDAVPLTYGSPRYSDGRPLPLPRSTYLGPDWNDWAFDTEQVFASVEHNLTNGWKAELLLDHAQDSLDAKRTYTTGPAYGSVDPATNAGQIVTGLFRDDNDRYGVNARASGLFSLLGRSHTAFLGAGYRRYQTAKDYVGLPSIEIDDLLNFNPHAVAEPDNIDFPSRNISDVSQYGIHAGSRFSVNDAISLVLGGRFDWYEVVSEVRDLETGVITGQPDYSLDANFTPYLGAVWDFAEQWGLYASYADIFKPQTSEFTRDGDRLDPIVGANYEVGIKGEFRDGALNTSLALFRIDQQNRAQEDLGQPCVSAPVSEWCYVAQGEVRSEGVELELSGRLLPGWEVFAGYTYNTTKYQKDQANAGKAFMTQTPEHILRLWSSYQLLGGWNHLSVGAGVNAQSGYYGEDRWSGVRVEQGAYALVNARASWRFNDQLSVSLNGNNLFDKTYFAAIGQGWGNVYGNPRNVMLTLRYVL